MLFGCGLGERHRTYATHEYVKHIFKDINISLSSASNVLFVTRIDSFSGNYILLVDDCDDKYIKDLLSAFKIANTNGCESEMIDADKLRCQLKQDDVSAPAPPTSCESVSLFRTTVQSSFEKTPWHFFIYSAQGSSNDWRVYVRGLQIYN